MKKSLLLFALLFWVGVQTVMAQTVAKGRVMDGESPNDGLIGATVKVVGGTAGTQTDLDGNFELEMPENSSGKVEISYTGYASQTVDASADIQITLAKASSVIDEVIITTPYGPPIVKGKYVGAADQVSKEKIENTPVSDVTKSIEGAAPGVQVTSGSGQPGSGSSIQLRGRGSLSASTNPLIVLDGAPYDGDITSINPLDVENMQILKDAMATSLYGARGSNGVILITTKKGQAGQKAKITVDGRMGTITRGQASYNVMTDPQEYYEAAWRGQYNKLVTNGESPEKAGTDASGLTSIKEAVVYKLGYNAYRLPGVGDSLQDAYLLDPTTGKLNPNAVLRYKDDWQKAIERTGMRQDYNVNVTGASDNSDYYLSAGYTNEKGYIINSDYRRFSTRLNVNSQATSWLKVGLNLSGSMSSGNNAQSGTSANSGNPMFVALTMAPVFPVYWRDANDQTVIDPATGKKKLDYGNPTGDPEFSMGQRANLPGGNIVGQLQSDENKTWIKNIVAVPYVQATFAKHFTFISRLNATYTNQYDQSYTNRTHGIQIGQGSLYKANQNIFSYNWNQMLTYTKTFGDDHELTVTGGHENYYMNYGYNTGYITGFISDAYREFDVATGTPTISSQTDNERMESYLAVANYTFKSKYLFQANIRRDGLSRFYKDVRWGNFGGAGIGWLIKQEDFMKDIKWINHLKIKASYGSTGNNAVTNANGSQNYYGYQKLYDVSRPNGDYSSAIPYTVANYNLKWETQHAVNAGIEFELFNSRLNGEVNVYNRQTDNLYYNVPNPPSTGIISQLLNTGSMYNRGVEITLYATPVQTKDFSWKINTNWTTNKNRVTKLAEGLDSVVNGNNILKPGYDYSSFYLVHSVGVDSSNGNELYSYYDSTSADGSKIRDTSDYATAQGYKTIVGNASPKFYGSVTNTLTYKGFQFSFLVTYGVGGKFYDATYASIMASNLSPLGQSNLSKDIEGAWTEDNRQATLPRLEWDNKDIGGASDRFLTDASYISIRNINLRYSLPKNVLNKAGINSMSAYIAADNIAFFSKRQGMNPQASFSGSTAYPYTPARTIIFGLTLGL